MKLLKNIQFNYKNIYINYNNNNKEKIYNK